MKELKFMMKQGGCVSDLGFGNKKENNMPQGLQVWDENGLITLDTSNRVTTLLAEFERSGDNFQISYANDMFMNNNYFYILSPSTLGAKGTPLIVETDLVGNTLTISVENNDRPRKIYIGVY